MYSHPLCLRCSGVGLNLTAGNKVFLLDPWWNPAAEDQAVDRVHRLGQEKDVEIVRFCVQGSVEERICTPFFLSFFLFLLFDSSSLLMCGAE